MLYKLFEINLVSYFRANVCSKILDLSDKVDKNWLLRVSNLLLELHQAHPELRGLLVGAATNVHTWPLDDFAGSDIANDSATSAHLHRVDSNMIHVQGHGLSNAATLGSD